MSSLVYLDTLQRGVALRLQRIMSAPPNRPAPNYTMPPRARDEVKGFLLWKDALAVVETLEVKGLE